MIYLILFFITAYFMVYFAKRLTNSGEKLGSSMGLDASWVGILLLASVTSLPELITGISSTLMGNHSMAVSNVFGSNVFNIFIIFIIDIVVLKKFVFISKISLKESLPLIKLSLIMTGLFLVGFFFRDILIFGQSLFIILIFITYIFYIKNNKGNDKGSDYNKEGKSIKNELKDFAIDSTGVLILGVILAIISDSLSKISILGITLGENIVGVLLLAISTSLPELIVSIESIKNGNFRQSLGNILGSNVFNLSTLFVIDLFTKGSFYKNLSINEFIFPFFFIFIQMFLIYGINKRKSKVSFILAGTYFASLFFTFIKN